jgi:hypothetical protein
MSFWDDGPALRSWAEGYGLALSGVPEDLELLDQEIGKRSDDAVMTGLAGEVGLFLGTVIVNSAAGARWRACGQRPSGSSDGVGPCSLTSMPTQSLAGISDRRIRNCRRAMSDHQI